MADLHSSSTALRRFWSKVRKTESCWLWIAATTKGYGQFHHLDERYAHRVSWVLAHGPVPDGMRVLHHCDTPLCVNPSHLFLGTARDNTADMVSKRRHAHGAKTGTAKLTEDSVHLIAKMWAEGKSSTEISKQLGIVFGTVCAITRGQLWSHVAINWAAVNERRRTSKLLCPRGHLYTLKSPNSTSKKQRCKTCEREWRLAREKKALGSKEPR